METGSPTILLVLGRLVAPVGPEEGARPAEPGRTGHGSIRCLSDPGTG